MYTCSKCPFKSEFDFSVNIHEKTSHPLYPRKDLFECTKSNIERRFYLNKTHLSVDSDNYLRNGHDTKKKEFNKDLKTVEEKCPYRDFKTFSKFVRFVHEFYRRKDGDIVSGKHARQSKNKNTRFKYYKSKPKTARRLNLKIYKLYRSTRDGRIKWYHCEQCSYKSKRAFDVSVHIKRKHILDHKKPCFQCDHCLYKTCNYSDLKKHESLAHNKITWLTCLHCSYKTELSLDLSDHIISKHASSYSDDKITSFQCDQCPFKTSFKGVLTKHVILQHTADTINWFNCPHCSFKAKQSFLLSEHVRTNHPSDDRFKWIHCKQCPYKTLFLHQLYSHVKEKHNANLAVCEKSYFRCPHCSYRTSFKHTGCIERSRNNLPQ